MRTSQAIGYQEKILFLVNGCGIPAGIRIFNSDFLKREKENMRKNITMNQLLLTEKLINWEGICSTIILKVSDNYCTNSLWYTRQMKRRNCSEKAMDLVISMQS